MGPIESEEYNGVDVHGWKQVASRKRIRKQKPAAKGTNGAAEETATPDWEVSLAKAAAKIGPFDLTDFLERVPDPYPPVSSYRISRFLDYYKSALSGVPCLWREMFKESYLSNLFDVFHVPLSYIPEPAYQTSVDWLDQQFSDMSHKTYVAPLKKLVEKWKDHFLQLSSSPRDTLAGSPGSKPMKQITRNIFIFSLRSAGEGNTVLAEEATAKAIWSLNENVDCWKHWDSLYKESVEASVALLKKLVDEWKDHSLKLSSSPSDTLTCRDPDIMAVAKEGLRQRKAMDGKIELKEKHKALKAKLHSMQAVQWRRSLGDDESRCYRFLYHLILCLLLLVAWTTSAKATKQYEYESKEVEPRGEKNFVSYIWMVVTMFACLLPLVFFMRFLWRPNPEHVQLDSLPASNVQSGAGSGLVEAKPKRKNKKKRSMPDTPSLVKDLLELDTPSLIKGLPELDTPSLVKGLPELDTPRLVEGSFSGDTMFMNLYEEAWGKMRKVLLSDIIVEERKDVKVAEGYLQDRPVFIKCGVRSDEIDNEIAILIAADSHPNIIRYFCYEEQETCFSYCVERWICNFSSFVKFCEKERSGSVLAEESEYASSLKIILGEHRLWTAGKAPSPLLINLIRDVVLGIEHLHSLKIIHRDLRPKNVMIMYNGKTLIAKIDGMCIARAENRPSLPHRSRGKKSPGFQPPEQIKNDEETTAVDMFALGCLVFHALSSGKHPFPTGGVQKYEENIKKNRFNFCPIQPFTEAHDLVKRLVNVEPDSRPSASQVLLHPFFWNSEVKLAFFHEVSNRAGGYGSKLKKELDKNLEKAIGDTSWNTSLHLDLLAHIDKNSPRNANASMTSYIQFSKPYDFTLLSDLLRLIRNTEEHFMQLPRDIKPVFPDGVYIYFDSLFPKLLMEVYYVVYHECKGTKEFKRFFEAITPFEIVKL